MAAEQHNRLSSSWLTALKNIIGLVPALVLIAAIINTSSCGSGGLLTPVGGGGGGGGGSGSPTGSASGTPTPTGALAFVTNFNSGNVSSFTRNTMTGVLKLKGKPTSAGKKSGPRGVIAAPSGAFLYVANIADDNIYQFAIGANGVLTPLSPAFVSNGNNTLPDELAISSDGTLLWVTGQKGTVTWYTVNTSTGQITNGGSIAGFTTPFGITLHPTLAVLYVSDTTTGLIQPMSFDTGTGALSKTGFPAVASSDFPLATSPAAIAVDSAGAALFIADQGNGEASSFSIDGAGKLTPVFAVPNVSTTAVPVGVGIGVNAGNEFLFTANKGANSVSSFLVTSVTTVHSPPTTTTSPYNMPTGLVVDPQNMFVYTADFGDGTVSQSTINGSCGSSICAGLTVSTGGSGPFGITLAQ